MPKPEREPHPGQPGRFEDLPWRIRYRIRRFGFQAFGPPQLGGEADPLWSLDREREQRLDDRARRRAEARGHQPGTE